MTCVPVAVPGLLTEYLDDEVCLYRPDSDDVIVLNASATAIWRLIDGVRSPAEIVDELVRGYGVARESLEPDVEAAIGDLIARGFVTSTGTLDVEQPPRSAEIPAGG